MDDPTDAAALWPGLQALREQAREILRLASTRLVEQGLPPPQVSIGEPHRETADGTLYVLIASQTELTYAVTLESLTAQVQALLCSTIDWGLVPAADHPRLLRELADLELLQTRLDR